MVLVTGKKTKVPTKQKKFSEKTIYFLIACSVKVWKCTTDKRTEQTQVNLAVILHHVSYCVTIKLTHWRKQAEELKLK